MGFALCLSASSRRRCLIIALITLTSSCGGHVRDDDPRISGLIHHCFATVKESLFISGNCQNIEGSPYCDTVKALDAEQPSLSFAQLPPTLRAYHENPIYWAEQVHAVDRNLFGTHRDNLTIYGGLPVGTPLQIVEVSRWFNGENGTFWIGHAIIKDGEFKGRRILLPWEGHGQYGWIDAKFDIQARAESVIPEVDSRYLKSCETQQSGITISQ
jgi:hypothetical protein